MYSMAKEQALIVVLVVLTFLFGFTTQRFFKIDNLLLILRQVTIVGILSIGLTFVVIGGNMDLSISSIVSLTTVVAVRLHDSVGPGISVLIVLALGVLCGCVTGFLVGYLNLNGMITTLGMQNIILAGALIYSGNMYYSIKNQGTWFYSIARGTFASIPIQLIIYIVLIFAMQFILSKSLYGKKIIAVGNSITCSNYSGINSKNVILISYMIAGLFAAISGIVLTSRSMAGQCDAGTGMEFDALTGVVLGGTSLFGGSGSVLKSFIGVVIIGILKNGFLLLGWNDYIQWISQCVIIVAVVWVDVISKKRVIR
jgi:ribose transport system permease protein